MPAPDAEALPMHIESKLKRPDRVGSALFGLALIAIGSFVEFDRPGTPVFAIVLGLVFVIGGTWGT